jgi:hypothetical protein
MTDRRLTELWERWVRQAADEAGISTDELKRRLDSGEACLEIRATFSLPPDRRAGRSRG